MAELVVPLVIVGVAVWKQGCKMRERHRNDRNAVQRMHDEERCNALDDLQEPSQVLSCIVEGVYKHCQRKKVSYPRPISEHWTHWGYTSVGLENFPGTHNQVHEDRCRVGDLGKSKKNRVQAMLFERSDSQRRPWRVWMRVEGQAISVLLPKYVLAIRGTILSQRADIKSDGKICLETLYSSAGESVKRLLRAITAKCEPQDIWVAGHSLGAAVALLATRSLAIDHGIVINPHLFNPPYFTLDILAIKAMRGILNGWGDIGNEVLRVLGLENTWNIRAGTDKFAEICKYLMSIFSRTGCGIANSSYAENMEIESQKLLEIGYAPYLYLNPNDPICNDYIAHFRRCPQVNTSVPSEVLQWFVPAKSVHMIPSGVLYINNWADGPLEAHSLLQWFRYPHVNLTVERQGLTGRPYFRYS